MLDSKKSKINEHFVNKSNYNLRLLTDVAELTRRKNLPVSKSYRDQFLKEVLDYIV